MTNKTLLMLVVCKRYTYCMCKFGDSGSDTYGLLPNTSARFFMFCAQHLQKISNTHIANTFKVLTYENLTDEGMRTGYMR